MDATTTSARGKTFHPFPRLPSELRRAIYLLATPQRVVHVQERFRPHASYDEARAHFAETFPDCLWRQTLLDTTADRAAVQLHPSLLYFSHNWLQVSIISGDILEEERLYRLDSRGQTTAPPPQAIDGEQALNVLGQYLLDVNEAGRHGVEEQLWALCRLTQLYSRAPVPALLHTCAESREVLVESGFELAFGTRGTCSAAYTAALRKNVVLPGLTEDGHLDELLLRPEEHGGLTWFNFRTDTLYVSHSEHPWPEALCANQPWDVSAFLPHDLARVTRLALERASSLATVIAFGPDAATFRTLVDYLRLFPQLKQLLFAEWALLGGGGDDGPTASAVHEDMVCRGDEPWFYLAQRDVDAFLRDVFKVDDRTQQGTALGVATLQMRNELAGWTDQSSPPEYLAPQTRLWQATLATAAREQPLGGGRSGIPRLPGMQHFPACTLVHVGTEGLLEALQDARVAVWDDMHRRRDAVDGEPDAAPHLARPLMPPPWDEDGWFVDKIQPPRREQFVWGVQEQGQKTL
ncbi:2EXR family [Microdochium nivale]|nr:2EXR family [Microdochium nivale]